MKSFVKLSRYRDSKNGQKHKKSSTDVGLWKIQFVVKAVKSLIIVWIKSLVNWNEVSRGFCGHFLPTGAGKKWPKQLDGIRTSRRLKGLQHSSSLSWLAGNIRRTRALWFSRHLHCPLITQAVAEKSQILSRGGKVFNKLRFQHSLRSTLCSSLSLLCRGGS